MEPVALKHKEEIQRIAAGMIVLPGDLPIIFKMAIECGLRNLPGDVLGHVIACSVLNEESHTLTLNLSAFQMRTGMDLVGMVRKNESSTALTIIPTRFARKP